MKGSLSVKSPDGLGYSTRLLDEHGTPLPIWIERVEIYINANAPNTARLHVSMLDVDVKIAGEHVVTVCGHCGYAMSVPDQPTPNAEDNNAKRKD